MKPLERIPVAFVGEWRDRYYDIEGNLVHDTGWDHNQVQDTNAQLLAMWFMEALQGAPAITQGPQHLAIGSGAAGWDAVPPVKSYAATTLTAEQYRRAIVASEITYIDPVTKVVSVAATRAVEITMTMTTAQANGFVWREFGFFGGTANAGVDTGIMINWVSHGRIDKDNTMTVVRTCRFIFQLVP